MKKRTRKSSLFFIGPVYRHHRRSGESASDTTPGQRSACLRTLRKAGTGRYRMPYFFRIFTIRG